MLAREGAVEGLWLRAERQTGGKGRQGRVWQSPPGNFYASTLVRLQQGDPPAQTLALVAAVALHATILDYAPGTDVHIKWPNDLIAGGAKLSGILLERQGDAIIIGFGVNLAHHPEGLERPATSIRELTGLAPDPDNFTARLALSFTHWLQWWRSEGIAPIRSAWLSAAHPVGTPLAAYLPGEEPVHGHFDGLDEGGALRLRLANGEVRVIHAGDVFLI